MRRRHEADYQVELRFSREDVLNALRTCKEAMTAWSNLKWANRNLARLVGIALLLSRQLQGR